METPEEARRHVREALWHAYEREAGKALPPNIRKMLEELSEQPAAMPRARRRKRFGIF